MDNLAVFIIFYLFILIQRLTELMIAKKNEQWMKGKGAIEFGTKHYQVMVVMHVLFLVSFVAEKITFNRSLSGMWVALLIVFAGTQILRIWAISSLGKFWNTKIIVLPKADVIRSGPYRYIKHPNYLVVSIEFLIIPLLFNAYITACIFSLINAIVLVARIRAEEQALRELTEYDGTFQSSNRFFPKLLNKYDN
jgi:methyltransferase